MVVGIGRYRQRQGASRPQPRHLLPGKVIGGSVFLLSLIGALVWGGERLADPKILPVRRVSIEGQFKYITQQSLREAVAAQVSGGFLQVNLKAVQAAAEELPWVAQASVYRVWPDSLRIQVREQEPLARWGKDALVSVQGEIFAPAKKSFPEFLPELWGPAGSERLLTARLMAIQAQLKPLGLQVAELIMGERRDWQVKFAHGMELILGRAHSKQRLARFQQIYVRLLRLYQEDIRCIDMRYPNGFAVTWRGTTAPAWVREAAFDV